MLGDPIKEARIKELLDESREFGVSDITYDLVYEGIRCILKHEHDDYEECAEELIELGCNFNLDEVNEYAEKRRSIASTIDEGLLRGDILAGASIICNVRDSEYCKSFAFRSFLNRDIPDAPIFKYMKIIKRKADALTGSKLRIVYRNEDI